MLKILLDAMGGDNAPQATVQGAVDALKADKGISLVLTGRKAEIEVELAKYKYDKARIEIIDCEQVIDMNDIPTEAVRTKRNSSMVEGFWQLKKNDDIAALVTAGSTGAAIVGGQIIVGRIPKIKRAALCPAIPNSRGKMTLLCDCGANAECKPSMLCQFAVLGSAYAAAAFGAENPKVGLLSNGTEEHKGDPLHREVYSYLSKMPAIDFVGNVEGRDIMLGECDIVVSDGFSGNIALKSLEGCGKMILNTLKAEFKSSLSSMIGYLFAKGAIKRMRAKLDFDKVGGALLLGLKKPVIKSHGSSKPTTICNSILNAATICRGKLIDRVQNTLAKIDFTELIPDE